MSTDKIKAARAAQAARHARARGGNKGQEPMLSKLLYLIGSVCLVGGIMVCNDNWTTAAGAAADARQSFAISALFSGIVSFAILAAAGSALAYLKTIADNSDQ